MSEFVPTTEEVRQSFVYAESSEFVATVPGKGNDAWARVPASGDVKATRVRDGKIHTEATAEFDRWLAAHDAEVAAKAWDEGCIAGGNRKHHTNMTEEQAEKAWPNPYRKAVES